MGMCMKDYTYINNKPYFQKSRPYLKQRKKYVRNIKICTEHNAYLRIILIITNKGSGF